MNTAYCFTDMQLVRRNARHEIEATLFLIYANSPRYRAALSVTHAAIPCARGLESPFDTGPPSLYRHSRVARIPRPAEPSARAHTPRHFSTTSSLTPRPHSGELSHGHHRRLSLGLPTFTVAYHYYLCMNVNQVAQSVLHSVVLHSANPNVSLVPRELGVMGQLILQY